MTDEIVDIDISEERKRSESIWILFHGHIGIGKTLFMTGMVLWTILMDKIKVVITNYDLYGLPEGVEVFKSGSVRKIMERMLENYDPVAKTSKRKILVVIDEINNTLSSKQAASNISTWITTIASNARKYGVRAFYFSTQGRKQTDYRLRVNCSYQARPTGRSDIDGHPQAFYWNDTEDWETDSHRSEQNYEHAVLMASHYTVAQLEKAYNTTELVPIDLNPSVNEEELPAVMAKFLAWCARKEIILEEYKRTDVKDFIKRWDNDKIENVIPYSPAGCEVIFSECVRLGYIEPKMEKPEVAEEPIESHTDSSTVQVANNSDSTEPQSSASVTENERGVKDSPITPNEGSKIPPKKLYPSQQPKFCCGRM